jgi:hypothetical protein
LISADLTWCPAVLGINKIKISSRVHADLKKTSRDIPFGLSGCPFLFGLSLHLLYLNGILFAAPHVQLVITHTQFKNSLVYDQLGCVENKVLSSQKEKRILIK